MVVADIALAHTPQLSESQLEHLVELVIHGQHPREIAKRLHPDDRLARRRTYRRLMTVVLKDPRFEMGIRNSVAVEMVTGLGRATKALNRRSAQRNVPAIKLLYETTGVHNPRIKHEHSGEIKIKFEAPRPTFEHEDVVDATVVE